MHRKYKNKLKRLRNELKMKWTSLKEKNFKKREKL